MVKEEIQKRIKDWLDEQEFIYEFDEEEFGFALKLEIEGYEDYLVAVILANDNNCVFDFCLPILEVADLGEIVHFIMNINNGISAGAYRFDFDDNQIRYHNYINLAGDTVLTDEMLNSSFRGGWNGVEELFYYFVSVLNGSLSSIDALEELNQNTDESRFDSQLQEVRYKIEHDYLPVEYVLHTSDLLKELENENGLFEIYAQHFDTYDVANPYSTEDFKVFESFVMSYHVKRLLLPECEEQLICREIFLVYKEKFDGLETQEKRYFTLEHEKEDGKGKLMLCEWEYHEDDERWEHKNYGLVSSNTEYIFKMIKEIMGIRKS